ncbi:SAM-dependent DNA methyltransferase, partial [Staphylococcus aureus]|nr:SAM-dependent DNA methyltransferase [Staphylococcus aureus]
YVGLAEVEEDSEPFEQKMERITADLSEQFAKSKELEDQIRKSLEGLGYGV